MAPPEFDPVTVLHPPGIERPEILPGEPRKTEDIWHQLEWTVADLDAGAMLTDEVLYRRLAQNYPIAIMDNVPDSEISQEKIRHAAQYLFGRIPPEIIFGKNVTVSFSDNSDLFMDGTHRTPDKRHQWYLVDEDPDNLRVTIHVRSNTDVANTLVSLARAGQIRNYYRDMRQQSTTSDEHTGKVMHQISRLYDTFCETYGMEKGNMLDAVADASFSISQKDIIYVEDTEENILTHDPAAAFKSKKLTKILHEGSENAAYHFAETVSGRLNALGVKNPEILEFSHTFAPVITHLMPLLSIEKEFRKAYTSTADAARHTHSFTESVDRMIQGAAGHTDTARLYKKFMRESVNFSTYGTYIRELARITGEIFEGMDEAALNTQARELITINRELTRFDQEYKNNRYMREYMQDVIIMQYANRYSGQDKIINSLKQAFDNPTVRERFGIVTLLSDHESATADGALYIDYSRITDEDIARYGSLMKPVMEFSKKQGKNKLVTSYALGQLTLSLIRQLKQFIPEIDTVSETGKVGAVASNTDGVTQAYPPTGTIVVPKLVADMQSILARGTRTSLLQHPDGYVITNHVDQWGFQQLGKNDTGSNMFGYLPSLNLAVQSVFLQNAQDIRSVWDQDNGHEEAQLHVEPVDAKLKRNKRSLRLTDVITKIPTLLDMESYWFEVARRLGLYTNFIKADIVSDSTYVIPEGMNGTPITLNKLGESTRGGEMFFAAYFICLRSQSIVSWHKPSTDLPASMNMRMKMYK